MPQGVYSVNRGLQEQAQEAIKEIAVKTHVQKSIWPQIPVSTHLETIHKELNSLVLGPTNLLRY